MGRRKRTVIGFLPVEKVGDDCEGGIIPEDLLRYGLIPELVGRFPPVIQAEPLSEEDLVRVLTQPKNALIRQYQRLMELDGVELKFTDGAIRAIASKAMETGMGARGLRKVMEDLMLDLMYEIPSCSDLKRCIITEQVVNEGKGPILKKMALVAGEN